MISLSSPLHVGIYENNHLINSYKSKEQTSEILPVLFQTILSQYHCQKLFYAKGPGSFMAIKISYVFLRTLSIALNIPLYACDGFVFNENRPIRAMRTLYFMKKTDGVIYTEKFEDEIEQIFTLPKMIDESLFSKDTDPMYILPAV